MANVHTSRASMDSGGKKDYGIDASYKSEHRAQAT